MKNGAVLVMSCCVLAVAGAAFGEEVGKLQYVDSPSISSPAIYIQGRIFFQDKSAPGLVNSQARIARFGSDSTPMVMAIDSSKADAKAPDLMRLNFFGKVDFKDAPTVPLQIRPTGSDKTFHAVIPPTVIKIKDKGKTIPITVKGIYRKTESYRFARLQFGLVVQGKCKFGDKIYTVRISDRNGNFNFNSTDCPKLIGGKIRGIRGRGINADSVAIDISDGKSKAPVVAFLGQPVLVDGKWYKLEFTSSSMKIRAALVKVGTGMIKVDHDNWSATLIGAKHLLNVKGGREPIAVPADEYAIANYSELTAPGAKGRPGKISVGWRLRDGQKAKIVAVPAGKTTDVAVGSTLQAEVEVKQYSGTVRLNLKLTDANSGAVESLSLPGGRRPKAPKVTVYDAEGNEVYKCTLEYG